MNNGSTPCVHGELFTPFRYDRDTQESHDDEGLRSDDSITLVSWQAWLESAEIHVSMNVYVRAYLHYRKKEKKRPFHSSVRVSVLSFR